MAGAAEDLDDVGQIVFAGWIIGPDFHQVLPQQFGTEAIDAGVDEGDRELRGRGCFVFYDGANGAVLSEDDASIAGGIGEPRRD